MDQKAIDATGLDEPDARGGVVAPITHDYCQRQYHAAISGYGCMRRVAHTKRHSKRFAWTDKIDVSAVSTDGSWWDPQRVREIRAATYFERRSKLVAWSPRKQLKSGNCADYTVNSGFSYEGANIGQSVTFELCPERVNPIITGKANGSVWEGESDEDQYVATASVNQFTHPRNATTMAKFVYDLKW